MRGKTRNYRWHRNCKITQKFIRSSVHLCSSCSNIFLKVNIFFKNYKSHEMIQKYEKCEEWRRITDDTEIARWRRNSSVHLCSSSSNIIFKVNIFFKNYKSHEMIQKCEKCEEWRRITDDAEIRSSVPLGLLPQIYFLK